MESQVTDTDIIVSEKKPFAVEQFAIVVNYLIKVEVVLHLKEIEVFFNLNFLHS